MARQRGARWQADVLVDGARMRKSFATRQEAEDFENAVAQGFNPSKELTLGDAVEEFFDDLWGAAKSRDYIKGNWRVIHRYIPESTPLAQVDDARIGQFVRDMKRDGKKGGTINRKLANLRKLLVHAHDEKRLVAAPQKFKKLKQKEGNARERLLSPEEEQRTMHFFHHLGKPEVAHLITFMLYTGCRVNEALSLDRKRVQGRSATFHHKLVKNSQTRVVPLTAKAAEAWGEVCRMTNAPTPFGALLPYWTFRDHWARLKVHLGVEVDAEFVPHMLRHTCATRLVKANVPLPIVMKWLGHRSIQVTMRYTNLVPGDLAEAALALEEV